MFGGAFSLFKERPVEIVYKGGPISLDCEDTSLFFSRNWSIQTNKHGERSCYLAYNGDLFHRVKMGCVKGDGLVVDHIDGNGLNNKTENLRIATATQNNGNQKCNPIKLRNGKQVSSQYKGVYLDKQRGLFRAVIRINYKTIRLGYFRDERSAAIAYNDAAVAHYGEFACLNDVGANNG